MQANGDGENRKKLRYKYHNYSAPGAYFLTVCVKDRRQLLGTVKRVERNPNEVGDGAFATYRTNGLQYPNTVADVVLSPYGNILNDVIIDMKQNNKDVIIDRYVIMPNHFHLLVYIPGRNIITGDFQYGMSQAPSPTVEHHRVLKNGIEVVEHITDRSNETIPKFISILKRKCNMKYGENIWQRSFVDNIIKSDSIYQMVCRYIYENPMRWEQDKYFI